VIVSTLVLHLKVNEFFLEMSWWCKIRKYESLVKQKNLDYEMCK